MRGRIELDFAVSSGVKTVVPAGEIWDLLEDTGRIDQIVPGPIVQLSGMVSFKLDGAELLGSDYWIDFYTMVHLAELAAGSSPAITQSVVAGGLSGHVVFKRRQNALAEYFLEMNEAVAGSRGGSRLILQRTMPLQPLVDAWTYLWFRIRRLAAHLGDGPSISSIASRDLYFPDGYFDLVDKDLIDFATQAPIEDVLSKPMSFG